VLKEKSNRCPSTSSAHVSLLSVSRRCCLGSHCTPNAGMTLWRAACPSVDLASIAASNHNTGESQSRVQMPECEAVHSRNGNCIFKCLVRVTALPRAARMTAVSNETASRGSPITSPTPNPGDRRASFEPPRPGSVAFGLPRQLRQPGAQPFAGPRRAQARRHDAGAIAESW
jgi:hypothetical protein